MIPSRPKPAWAAAVPAHDEEKRVGRCTESGRASAARVAAAIELVVALNCGGDCEAAEGCHDAVAR